MATDENVEALVDMNGVWIDKVHDVAIQPKMIILDMDSSVSPTHGEQEAVVSVQWSLRLYLLHPLFLFNQFGGLGEMFARGAGNVHSARRMAECSGAGGDAL